MWRNEASTRRPSALPSSGSAFRSGWGIIPSTFPEEFTMPAMSARLPFGFWR